MDLWFKRKRYGWGWTPSTWQGWTVVCVYMIVVVAAALMLGEQPAKGDVMVFLLTALVSTTLLITITYRKGPSPKWRWGARPDDDPHQDF